MPGGDSGLSSLMLGENSSMLTGCGLSSSMLDGSALSSLLFGDSALYSSVLGVSFLSSSALDNFKLISFMLIGSDVCSSIWGGDSGLSFLELG